VSDLLTPARDSDDDHDPGFVETLCDEIAANSADMAKRIVDEIRAEQPSYWPVESAEHQEMVREQVLAVMDGLTSRRLPSPANVDKARALGGRRAEQGLPMEAVIGAYHIGCRELWSALLTRARAEDPRQAEHLLELVNLLFAWMRVLTGAAADGYGQAARAREQMRTRLGLQFLEALYGGQATAESTMRLARALDFDPYGEFQVICCPPDSCPVKNLDSFRERLRSGTGTFSAIARETALVILFQEIPASRIVELLEGRDGTVAAGVGLARPGLTGAAESLADAQRALRLAERQGGVVDFGTNWLTASLLSQIDRLQPLISTGQTVRQPHLRDAVRAYAQHGFSIAAGAQELGIHPNTMKYRLDRWTELTGFDPRTLDGLLRSLLDIAFS
jgi:hypothetical protein